jgi:hypothetical protein
MRGMRVWPTIAWALCAIIPVAGILSSPSAGIVQPAQPRQATELRTGPTMVVDPTAGPDPTTVTVDTSGNVAGEIGNGYIGLSFESGTLNSGQFNDVGDLPQLLRNLGSSVMRLGGNSVDTSYTGITPSALAGLARLARAAGWTVLYSEDLGHFNSADVTADTRAVSAALGGSLYAFACGNEPDDYKGNGLRPKSYTVSDYLTESATCFAAIRAGAPGVPLEGPDTAHSSWLAAYAARWAGQLGALGEHYYPLGCSTQGKSLGELASTMLSPAQAATEAAAFAQDKTDADVAGAPLLISETNSACHGGIHGLSNSFAAALWVVDYLLTGAENGVAGMNFHGALNNHCSGYTPLCQVGPKEWRAQPIYYGMLFTRLLGAGQLLPVTVSTSGNVTAFALKPADGGDLRLMVENLTQNSADVSLQVAGAQTASVLHLTAPSLLATSGVRIQGASVAANGSLQPGKANTARCSSGGCPITLAPYTAALVTVTQLIAGDDALSQFPRGLSRGYPRVIPPGRWAASGF